MIQPPFKANWDKSHIWIEDKNGVLVCEMNPVIDGAAAVVVAETLAKGTNSYLRRVDLARAAGKLGGRPRKLKKGKKESISRSGAKSAGAKKR